MDITPEVRARLSIAASQHELLALCGFILLHPGGTALLIPFGGKEEDGVIINEDYDLVKKGLSLLEEAAFGYVHVIRTTAKP